jgi:hypothetical protein
MFIPIWILQPNPTQAQRTYTIYSCIFSSNSAKTIMCDSSFVLFMESYIWDIDSTIKRRKFKSIVENRFRCIVYGSLELATLIPNISLLSFFNEILGENRENTKLVANMKTQPFSCYSKFLKRIHSNSAYKPESVTLVQTRFCCVKSRYTTSLFNFHPFIDCRRGHK